VVHEMTVSSVMTTRLVAVEPETPLRKLVSIMTEERVSAVPVVDRRGQPIGVVTAEDLAVGRNVSGGRENAAELMTTRVRAVHADEPVSFAARLFAKTGIRRLCVVDWDSRLVGVVARHDVLRSPLRDEADPELATP